MFEMIFHIFKHDVVISILLGIHENMKKLLTRLHKYMEILFLAPKGGAGHSEKNTIFLNYLIVDVFFMN